MDICSPGHLYYLARLPGLSPIRFLAWSTADSALRTASIKSSHANGYLNASAPTPQQPPQYAEPGRITMLRLGNNWVPRRGSAACRARDRWHKLTHVSGTLDHSFPLSCISLHLYVLQYNHTYLLYNENTPVSEQWTCRHTPNIWTKAELLFLNNLLL